MQTFPSRNQGFLCCLKTTRTPRVSLILCSCISRISLNCLNGSIIAAAAEANIHHKVFIYSDLGQNKQGKCVIK